MSYIVLARKYRPRRFEDVVGQEAIATTLQNSIKLDRVHHAYLFAGPRGVGKTSLARIFAKALNCGLDVVSKGKETPEGSDIDNGRSMDVLEIDGASNRGIEDVRAIRENIKFAPAQGKYKIYIIDEVHQITQDAFNALLKTLEEPPAHAKFIFATTSVQKVPATILSRCQRFEFKRISTERIQEVLEDICKKENFKIDKTALFEIAKAADGSLRDSQSLLDQVASYSKGQIDFETVSSLLGIVKQEDFVELFDAFLEQDSKKVLDTIDRIVNGGKDLGYYLEKCVEHARNLMVVFVSKDYEALMDVGQHYAKLIGEQATRFSKQDLFYIYAVLTHTLMNLRRYSIQRVALEMAFLKCTMREPMISLDSLSASETSSGSKAAAPQASASKNSPSDPKKKVTETNSASSSAEVAENEVAVDSSVNLNAIWPRLMKRVQQDKISTASFLMGANPLTHDGQTVVIGFPSDKSFHIEALTAQENMDLIQRHLSDLLQKDTQIKFILQDGGEAARNPDDDEIVKVAKGIFGGRVIRR